MTSTTPTNRYDPFSSDEPHYGWDPFGDEPPPAKREPWFSYPALLGRYGAVLTCRRQDEPPFGVVVPPIPDGWELVPGEEHVIREIREDREPPLPPVAKPTRRPARTPLRRAAPKVVPTTGVETREPADQNDHTLAMINSHQLSGTPMLIAMVASVEIAISASKAGRPFGRTERDLTHAYLAGKTGLSEETVRINADKAVRLGFLERTDNAQGGKRDARGVGRNRSTYRARIPAYMTPDA